MHRRQQPLAPVLPQDVEEAAVEIFAGVADLRIGADHPLRQRAPRTGFSAPNRASSQSRRRKPRQNLNSGRPT